MNLAQPIIRWSYRCRKLLGLRELDVRFLRRRCTNRVTASSYYISPDGEIVASLVPGGKIVENRQMCGYDNRFGARVCHRCGDSLMVYDLRDLSIFALLVGSIPGVVYGVRYLFGC